MLRSQCRQLCCLVLSLVCGAGWTTAAHATCLDWASVPTVAPIMSWDGPGFHNTVGGIVRPGYMVKSTVTVWDEHFFYVYDIRNPLLPNEIYSAFVSVFDAFDVSIAAAEDSLCVIGLLSNYGFDHQMLIADNPSVHYNTPLSGMVALAGARMFQTALSWEDGRSGIGCYDISNLASIVELGFHSDAIELEQPLALSNEAILVVGPGYELQFVDFSTPATPVVRGRVVLNGGMSASFRQWLGRDGNRVYFADQVQMYAIDVSDPDNLQVEYTIPGRVTSLAIQGDFGALKFDTGGFFIRIFRLKGSGSPAAVSGYFGAYTPHSVSWSGDTVYQGGIAAYDVSDPALPVFIGSSSASSGSFNGSYVQDGYLVTGNGPFPLHCAGVAAVGGGVDAGSHISASPNPFNPRTSLTVEIGKGGPARLDIYDVRGRWIRNLLDGEIGIGSHSVAWDGQDSQGRASAAGIYRARLVAADGVHEAKLTLVR